MKISTEGIQGFAEMSAEQKLAAVLAMDVPDPVDMSQYVDKRTFDAKASEAAELSKKLKGKMTEDEAAAAERQAQWDELVATNKAQAERIQKLELASTEAAYKAKYLAMPGFDEKLAEDTAKAMASGDMDKVFDNQQKANEAYKKQVQAEMVKGDPKPGGAGAGSGGEQDKATEIAELIGSERAKELESSNNILKHYLGG